MLSSSEQHISQRLSSNSHIDGLFIIDDFITEQEEVELIDSIDLREWSGNGIP